MRFMLFAALAVALVAPTASAGGGHDPVAVVQHIFDVADQDQDGSLTREEYEAAGLEHGGGAVIRTAGVNL